MRRYCTFVRPILSGYAIAGTNLTPLLTPPRINFDSGAYGEYQWKSSRRDTPTLRALTGTSPNLRQSLAAVNSRRVQNRRSLRIENLLGRNVVLLPIATRKKAPDFPGWNEVTVDRMRDFDYRSRFTENIGVLLG